MLNASTGALIGTPTLYTAGASLLIEPLGDDGAGNLVKGSSVSITINVGPREVPQAVAFTDTNPRALVFNGTVIITPALDETNFTDYFYSLSRHDDAVDFPTYAPITKNNVSMASAVITAVANVL